MWDMEYTNEFRAWWETLTAAQQEDVAAAVQLLQEHGPTLRFPHTSGITGSRHAHLRELRVQSGGRPLRIFYAFDPRRTAPMGWSRGSWSAPVSTRRRNFAVCAIRHARRCSMRGARS